MSTSTIPERRYPVADAAHVVNELMDVLWPGCDRLAIAGSIRRGKPEVKDIELLAIPRRQVAARDLFGEPIAWSNQLDDIVLRLLDEGILEHRLDINGRPAFGERYKRLRYGGDGPARGIGLDLFSVLPPAQYGLQLVIRTGPHEFSKQVVTPRGSLTTDARPGFLPFGHRSRDGGIWRLGPLGEPVELIEMPEEDDVFRFLGMSYLPAEERR